MTTKLIIVNTIKIIPWVLRNLSPVVAQMKMIQEELQYSLKNPSIYQKWQHTHPTHTYTHQLSRI